MFAFYYRSGHGAFATTMEAYNWLDGAGAALPVSIHAWGGPQQWMDAFRLGSMTGDPELISGRKGSIWSQEGAGDWTFTAAALVMVDDGPTIPLLLSNRQRRRNTHSVG